MLELFLANMLYCDTPTKLPKSHLGRLTASAVSAINRISPFNRTAEQKKQENIELKKAEIKKAEKQIILAKSRIRILKEWSQENGIDHDAPLSQYNAAIEIWHKLEEQKDKMERELLALQSQES
jgi:hypothetical protein